MNNIKAVEKWYQESYGKDGFAAQRLYPNEELLRFFGRNYFKFRPEERRRFKVLDLGCGSCSNLWMVAHEGFEAHGIDIAEESLKLGDQMLQKWGAQAKLVQGSFTEIPYNDESFDVVYDVWATYCLTILDFEKFLVELRRVLKPGGRFFSYLPSSNSDAFINYAPAKKLDELTLDGIRRETSVYYGNFYPCRFSEPQWLKKTLDQAGFELPYFETITRTYRAGKERLEIFSLEAVKR